MCFPARIAQQRAKSFFPSHKSHSEIISRKEAKSNSRALFPVSCILWEEDEYRRHGEEEEYIVLAVAEPKTAF